MDMREREFLQCHECGAGVEYGNNCTCGATWLGIVFYIPVSHLSSTRLICDKMRSLGLASEIMERRISKLIQRIDRLDKRLSRLNELQPNPLEEAQDVSHR